MRPAHWIVLAAIALPAVQVDGQDLAPGDLAPNPGIESLLQAPRGANWESLRGNVVVLEFWATWCGPCVAAVPHLNELANEYVDSPVRFISITDEKPAVINRFLAKRPMKSWIGLDPDRSAHRRYGVRGIPLTVLIDRNGEIAAITRPQHLTPAVLDALLAGAPLTLPPIVPVPVPATDRNTDDPPLCQVALKRSTSRVMRQSKTLRTYSYRGMTAANLFAMVHDLPELRIRDEAALPEGRYDAVVTTPFANTRQQTVGDRNRTRQLIRQSLQASFRARLETEQRKLDVQVLTVVNPVQAADRAVAVSGSSAESGDGYYQAVAVSTQDLALFLERTLGVPVVNETSLAGRFDINLDWETGSRAALLAELEDKIGLTLTPSQRMLSVGVIRPVQD